MRIVKANQEDLQSILDLQYLAYQSEAELFHSKKIPPLTQTLEEVNKEYQKGIILKAITENNQIIGSVRARCEKGTVYIGKLMVHPAYQGQGIGTKLLVEIEKCYTHVRYELFTSTRSKKNIQMYEHLGYKVFNEKQVNEEIRFVYLEKML